MRKKIRSEALQIVRESYVDYVRECGDKCGLRRYVELIEGCESTPWEWYFDWDTQDDRHETSRALSEHGYEPRYSEQHIDDTKPFEIDEEMLGEINAFLDQCDKVLFDEEEFEKPVPYA